MNDTDNLVAVSILDKVYKIKCPSKQSCELQQSAAYLDEHVRKLRRTTHIPHLENLLVVAALNITHELLALKNHKNQSIENITLRIQQLQQRIQESLALDEEVLV